MSKRKTTKTWSEAEATRVLEEQRRSGKSVARFAKDRGLVPERLYWWQRKLGREAREPARRGRQAPRRASAMTFAEVRPRAVANARAGSGAAAERLEVVLAGGRRISVPSGFVAADVQRLIAAVESAAC